MQISIIAAIASNRVIGIHNQLPWHIPEDLAWFKTHTLGKPVVMGRKTYESIGKPLPGRLNIILTQNSNFSAPGCICLKTLPEILNFLSSHQEIMIIGGTHLYDLFLPLSHRMYLTLIDKAFIGDALFPLFNRNQWHEIFQSSHVMPSTPEPLTYHHCILEKNP